MQKNTLATVIRVALYGAASIGGFSTVAVAQQAPDAAKKDETMTLDAITVLGSRIKRTEVETALPVITIDRAELERSGLTQVGDILKELAINGPSLSLNTNNGNTSGIVRVNLRGCGAQRTLVLVNGQRWVSDVGLGGAVDLSSIPFAAVERVEVLKEGASSLYGTDAICGVINITTKSNFSGAQLKAYYGQYDQDDGARQAYDFTFGHSADRWSALINASYTKQDAVSAGNRDISAVPLFGFPANTSSPGRASGTTPYGTFKVGGTTYTLDPSKPGCAVGVPCTAKGDFKPYDFVTDGYNFAPVNYLIQPQTTKGLFAEGTYKILDNVRLRVNGFLNERTGEAQLAAQPLSGLSIDANNIYNPFGTKITGASFRPTLFPRLFDQYQITRRFSAALEGVFELWGKPYNWDVGAIYGKNKFDLSKHGFEFTTNLKEALGPSFISNGKPTCGTAAAPATDGCVPLNVFGGPKGVTSDMFNFLAVSPRNVQVYRVDNYTANISGPIVALPAGDLAFAAGYEYRKEKGSDTPDPLTQANLVFNDNPALPTKGTYDLNEFYVELDAPLLKDVAFAHSLDISLAARRSDYSSFGNTTNPKVSLHWQPIEDLLVRGSWGKGFRAPSINELYQGQATGRPTIDDPCSIDSPVYASRVQANCAAAGVPAGFKKVNSQGFLTTGGNPNLKPETSTNKTFGFVYSPSFVEGFDTSIDWYNIRIENAVGSNGAQTILNNCYLFGINSYCGLITRDRTGAMFANIGEQIAMVGFNRNFVGGLEIEGVDFAINYHFKTDNYGSYRFNWSNAYISYFGDVGKPKRGEVNGDGVISSGNTIGQEGTSGSSTGATQFRLRSTLNAIWDISNFSFSGTAEYYSRIAETCNTATSTANNLKARGITTGYVNLCTDPGRIANVYSYVPGTTTVVAAPASQPRNIFPSVTYIDFQASYNAPWKGKITAGIRNLFDRKAPFSSDAFANSFDAQYRIPGRFFYASYQQNFDLFK